MSRAPAMLMPCALFALVAAVLATGVLPHGFALQPPSLRSPPWRMTTAPANRSAAHSNRVTDDTPMGCKELRSKRYISDGFCTSVKPVTEVVCSGVCLPVNELPWYAQYAKLWARGTTEEWRCVDDVIRHKRVYLLCENGERRTYRIKVVRACKCKKFRKTHNKTTRKKGKTVDAFYD